jgi:hypothetical protein
MPKDGPPISGGYRYGGNEALRAGLPPKAADLRSKPTNAELQARLNLAKFTEYVIRARSIGKPLPNTLGVSTRRANALRQIEKVRKQELAEKSVILRQGATYQLKWIFRGERKGRLLLEDFENGVCKLSCKFRDKHIALFYWDLNSRVMWAKRYDLS